jgi:diguanylate cyclase (GGDEF)-like protein
VRSLEAQVDRERQRQKDLARALAHAQAQLAEVRVQLEEARTGEHTARHMALHDSLTALPNRRFFHQHLQQQFEESARAGRLLAVLYIDLDRFKPINDRHGHDAGDEALKIIAARLAHAVRAEDMMSRLGGDEFACLLTNQPQRAQLVEFAVKLVEAVSAPMTIEGFSVQVRPSIGIALAPHHGASPDAIIRSADRAMLFAKRRRCGVSFFDDCASIVGAAHGADAAIF